MVPAPPASPALRKRYDLRQQELVYASAKVFADRGYDQTTMQDLASSIGLATGALYHYFGSKEQLLIKICDQLMEPLLARARVIVAGDGSPSDRLRELVRLWVATVVEYRDHMLVFQQERHTIESGDQWRGVRQSRKAFERLVEHALEHAGATGAANLEGRLALLALLGMVNHTAQWYKPRGRLRPNEIADGYLSLLLDRAEPDGR